MRCGGNARDDLHSAASDEKMTRSPGGRSDSGVRRLMDCRFLRQFVGTGDAIQEASCLTPETWRSARLEPCGHGDLLVCKRPWPTQRATSTQRWSWFCRSPKAFIGAFTKPCAMRFSPAASACGPAW